MVKPTRMLSIGGLAKACGVAAPTIRYYEKIALMPAPERSRSDQRRYDQTAIERLDFIRRCRSFGFSTQQVRSLLAVPNGSAVDCRISKEIAQSRIADIRLRISDLLALETDLNAVIGQCETGCRDQTDQVCAAFVTMQTTPDQPRPSPSTGLPEHNTPD